MADSAKVSWLMAVPQSVGWLSLIISSQFQLFHCCFRWNENKYIWCDMLYWQNENSYEPKSDGHRIFLIRLLPPAMLRWQTVFSLKKEIQRFQQFQQECKVWNFSVNNVIIIDNVGCKFTNSDTQGGPIRKHVCINQYEYWQYDSI